MIRVVHINFSDTAGGASRAMWRIHKGLKNAGVDSKIYCFQSSVKNPDVIRYNPPKSLHRKLLIFIRKRSLNRVLAEYKMPHGHEAFSDDRTQFGDDILRQLPEADIYHLHWVAGFLDLPSFFKKIIKPVIWTLHDMNPFTGGCHYSSGCNRFTSECGSCPQLNSESDKDLSYKVLRRKSGYISKETYIATNSIWLKGKALNSTLFKNLRVRSINLGVDTDIFKPGNKEAIRKAFNLPSDKRIILSGAMDNSNKRKGFRELSEALEILEKMYPGIFFLTFGRGNSGIRPGNNSMNVGIIENDLILSLIYSSADVFVISSLEEAFGQTAMESMSCGVPVAGFNSGGIPEIVEDGVTGFLAETGDIKGLADSIYRLISLGTNDYEIMAANCRKRVLDGFTLSHQADQYIKVYSQLQIQEQ